MKQYIALIILPLPTSHLHTKQITIHCPNLLNSHTQAYDKNVTGMHMTENTTTIFYKAKHDISKVQDT